MADNTTTLQLGNSNVQFRIDAGADETIPEEVYKELQDPLKSQSSQRSRQETRWCWRQKRANTGGHVHSCPTEKDQGSNPEHLRSQRGMQVIAGNPGIEALQLIPRVESVEGTIDYQNEFSDLFEGLGSHYDGRCLAFRHHRTKKTTSTIDGQNKERAEKDGRNGSDNENRTTY